MGYPLRSNIFKLGTWEQREFARFPVQTAVLYSANDHREFAEAFRSFFSYLDRITGDEVVFFAILEPPEDWLQLAHATRWADRHFYGNKGQVHLRIEDDVLVREMARIFSVSWDELPVLIASPNLWLGEYCVVPTDVKYFESQFQVLIDLVQKWGRPNLGLIKNAFEEEFSIPTSIYTPRNQLRERLITSYQFYESAEAGDRTDFMRSLRRQVENSQKSIFEARKAFIISNRTDEGIDDDSLSVIDTVSEDAAGQLVVPATLAYRFMQRIKEPSFFPTIEVLDPESSILLETALRVGDFLEITAEQGISFIDQRRPRSVKDFRNRSQKLDFSAAASGAWKALEREINFSIIQAARLARGVPMPSKFAQYDPDLLPQIRGVVQTGRDRQGRPINVFINQEDWERRHIDQRHRFIELGKALFLYCSLNADPQQEQFMTIIYDAIGNELPTEIIDGWRQVQQIRNPGSHTELVNFERYKKVLQVIFGSKFLPILSKIKIHICGGEQNIKTRLFQYNQQQEIKSVRNSEYYKSYRKSTFSSLKAGKKVQAKIVEVPKGKGRLWAAISGGPPGPILNEGTPQSTKVGTTVSLVIHAVNRDRFDFCWPDAPRLQRKKNK